MESTEKPKEVSKVSKRSVSVLVLLLLALMTVVVLAGLLLYNKYSNKKETTETPVAGTPILHIDNQPNLATAPCDCEKGKTTRNRGSGGKAGATQGAKGAAVAVAKPVIDKSASSVAQETPLNTGTQATVKKYKSVIGVRDKNFGKPQVEVVPLEESSVTTEIIVIEADSGGYGHHDHRDYRRHEQPVYDVPAYVPGSVLREYQASVQQDHRQSQQPVYDVPAYVPGTVTREYQESIKKSKYVPPLSSGPNGGGGAQGPVNPAP